MLFFIIFSSTGLFAANTTPELPLQEFSEGQYHQVTTGHATATLYSNRHTLTAGETITLALRIAPEAGWHTYWLNPGDSGLPLTTKWTLPEGSTVLPPRWPAPERISLGEGFTDYGYHNAADILFMVQLPASFAETAAPPVSLEATWLICKDICIPETATFILSLPVAAAAQPAHIPVARWFRQRLEAMPVEVLRPVPLYQESGKSYLVLPDDMQAGDPWQQLLFFPETPGLLAPSAAQTWQTPVLTLDAVLPEDDRPDILHGVLKATTSKGTTTALRIAAQPAGALPPSVAVTPSVDNAAAQDSAAPMESGVPQAVPALSLTLLALAFVGGLLLNVMPCVLPVLSIKALSLANLSATRQGQASARREGLLYTAGVLTGFTVVAGIVLLLRQHGISSGWGFQMQVPAFVLTMTLVLFLAGLLFSGLYTLAPGVRLLPASTAHVNSGNALATGLLAVLVATPCTVPFMAAAVGAALAAPPLQALAVFWALALGMALPMLLLTFFPALRRWLPKSGGWMETFKQALAFPLYASAAWLLWVLVRQTGDEGLLLALSGTLLLAFTGWLTPYCRTRAQLLTLLFVTVCLSVLLVQRASVLPERPEGHAAAIESDTARPFSLQALEQALANNKTVLVNVTADWCLTCKLNEKTTLASAAVQRRLAEPDTVYLVADWTQRDEAIQRFLTSHGRGGVPLYVLYQHNRPPQLLPQLLTPSLLLEALQ